jgi:hypothetical protein
MWCSVAGHSMLNIADRIIKVTDIHGLARRLFHIVLIVTLVLHGFSWVIYRCSLSHV